ncbi:uncharacterized protein LOC110448403 [Mizuhopecten yessoensis]|uniref:Mammalian ependymin-related protein 1 n=1 Tax=Mizuhopecten yessoensis TaxID=6573 RepID=A0A210QTB7_MIZYE|nr:uncharacterized protein LOC110448403 [Mizuhopecten yessoensis]OWF51962.1 hypothetical protein KP79_PYT18462 [Mizuhopecten yessoensis]
MITWTVFTCVVFLFAGVTNGQTPCCSPDQWTGHLLQNTGEYNRVVDTASKADVSTFIYYDHPGRRLATLHDVYNQTTDNRTSVQRIINYSKGLEWRIVGKVCTLHKVTEVMPSPCFLDGASSFGNHMIYKLPVQVWYKEFSDGGNIRSTVAKDNCLLVTETSLSILSGPDYMLSFGVYENITGGSVPSSPFQIPSSCPQSGPVYPGSATPYRPWYLPNDILARR